MQTVAGTRARLAEFVRRPTTLALLLLLPPVAIEIYGVATTSFPALPGLTTDPATAGRMAGALFAVAFLAGLVGLFQVLSARRGDQRLVLCGFPRWLLLVTRLATVAAVAGAVAAVAFAVFAWRVDAAAPLLAFAVLAVAGLLYGLLGVVVGTLLPRELEGSLVLVFLADADNVLSSGLFEVGEVASLAPLYHPHALFEAAVLEGELADGHLLPTLAYLAGLLAVAALAHAATTDGGVGG